MKNSQKGSTVMWVMLISIVLVVIVGGYVFLSGKGLCRITRGDTTTYEPCPSTTPGTISTNAQTDYDKIGQAIKDTTAKSRSTSPSGYLIPIAPVGYTLSTTSPHFTVDTAGYLFTNTAGNTVYFMESPTLYNDAYAQLQADREYQVLETFNTDGWVSVYYHHTNINGKPASSMYLIYDHNGHLVSIQSDSPSMTGKDLENILNSATVAK